MKKSRTVRAPLVLNLRPRVLCTRVALLIDAELELVELAVRSGLLWC